MIGCCGFIELAGEAKKRINTSDIHVLRDSPVSPSSPDHLAARFHSIVDCLIALQAYRTPHERQACLRARYSAKYAVKLVI
jgi:hypothetical protein